VKSLLVATTNRHKLLEIRPFLAGLPFEIVTLDDVDSVPAPEETGQTFAENARAKALYYARATGALTVAEDSGLVIDALGGLPGVESARYGGTETPYPQKFELIYAALRIRNALNSPARFICAVALVNGARAANGVVFETEGAIEGKIADKPKGDGGFGYDPIFYYPPFGSTLAEAGDRKGTVSHRSKAFRALRTFLVQSSGF